MALAADGAVKVDDHSRTNVPGVWAIGDVTNRINLTVCVSLCDVFVWSGMRSFASTSRCVACAEF